jgi:pimeloyl-ACP methyl ester carboxylesterase
VLHYQIKGQGPALFFLHGFLEDHQIWDALVEELSRRHRCIVIDFPGYGNNRQQAFPDRLEPLAQALEDLRAQLSLNEFSIIGHSMGVYIGLAWLNLCRIQPKSFVAVNGSVHPDSPERLIERKRSISLVSRHKDAYVKMAIKGLFLSEKIAEYAAEIEALTDRALQCPVAALTQSIQAMSERENHLHTLREFSGEKHIIAGMSDPLFAQELSENMARETGAYLHTYPGSHMGWLEAPDLILEVLGSERIPSASD